MIELAAIMGTVSALSDTIGKVTDALDKTKALEVQKQLNDALIMMTSVISENLELTSENGRLKEELKQRKALEYIDGSYYLFVDGEKDGPLCPKCYKEWEIIQRLDGARRCPHCRSRY